MKKVYQRPAGETVRLEAESPLLTSSTVNVHINDDETREASSGLNNKKQGIWDSDEWAQTNW